MFYGVIVYLNLVPTVSSYQWNVGGVLIIVTSLIHNTVSVTEGLLSLTQLEYRDGMEGESHALQFYQLESSES